MIEDLKNSWIIAVAQFRRAMNGGKALISYDVPFGIFGATMSRNMTEHFVGGARVTIIPMDGGTYFQVDNTTDQNSHKAHLADSYPRAPEDTTPGGTIFQRFIWFVED